MSTIDRDNQVETIAAPTIEEAIDALHAWAVIHAANGSGKLVAMEPDDPRFPTELISTIAVPWETDESGLYRPQTARDPAFIGEYISRIEPSFAYMQEHLRSPENALALNTTAEILARGDNVIMATNHGNAEDLIITHAALVGEVAQRESGFRTATILAHLQRCLLMNVGTDEDPKLVPVDEIVSLLEDETFYSFPESKSVATFFPPERFGTYPEKSNTQMIRPLLKSLRQGGVFMGLCPGGSTDYLDPTDASLLHIPHVPTASAKILTRPNVYILPVGNMKTPDGRVLEIVSEPYQVSTVEEVHDAMGAIADVLDEAQPHLRVTFDRKAA